MRRAREKVKYAAACFFFSHRKRGFLRCRGSYLPLVTAERPAMLRISRTLCGMGRIRKSILWANAFPLPRETMFPAPLCGSLLLKTTMTTYETGVDHLACPHLSISIVKRSAGQSAVASAAYQSGSTLYSEHDQKRKSYSEKQGIVYTEIMLCANAPPA